MIPENRHDAEGGPDGTLLRNEPLAQPGGRGPRPSPPGDSKGLSGAASTPVGVARRSGARSKAKYEELRSRGQSHGRALRGVADRLLVVMCAMLRDATLYDPARQPAVKAA